MIICRENGLSPDLSLENATWCNMRVCSSLPLSSPKQLCRVGPKFSVDELGGRKIMWNSGLPKDGARDLLPQERCCPAGTLGSCLKPRAALESCLSADSARKLHIFKLPGFSRSYSLKRQMWATVEPLYLYFRKAGQEILFLLDTYI